MDNVFFATINIGLNPRRCVLAKKGVSAFKVAATYIGTIVGAGFATGQEVLQFFTNFGAWGLLGLLLATLMFALFGYIIMGLGQQLNARSHQEIVNRTGGRFLGAAIDYIIVFFLFGALAAMLAGTGALFTQQFRLPALLGSLVMGVLTVLTVLHGIKGVINAISYVVPFLIISVVGISIYTVFTTPPDWGLTGQHAPEAVADNSVLISNWLVSAVLYVSYNIILSIAVLGPLGNAARDIKTIRYGAVLGGLGLGLGALMIFLAIASDFAIVSRLEVPMVYIAGSISPLVQGIYTVVLVAEIYTTAVGALYGFTVRLTDIKRRSAKTRLIVIATASAALLASQFGFSNLVKYLYPMMGYAGLVLLALLVSHKIRRKKYTTLR
jgi:uncharacterized membrane protein YkvI